MFYNSFETELQHAAEPRRAHDRNGSLQKFWALFYAAAITIRVWIRRENIDGTGAYRTRTSNLSVQRQYHINRIYERGKLILIMYPEIRPGSRVSGSDTHVPPIASDPVRAAAGYLCSIRKGARRGIGEEKYSLSICLCCPAVVPSKVVPFQRADCRVCCRVENPISGSESFNKLFYCGGVQFALRRAQWIIIMIYIIDILCTISNTSKQGA